LIGIFYNLNYIFVLSLKGMFKIAIGKADFEVLDTTKCG
jgi:hypothetical protein